MPSSYPERTWMHTTPSMPSLVDDVVSPLLARALADPAATADQLPGQARVRDTVAMKAE